MIKTRAASITNQLSQELLITAKDLLAEELGTAEQQALRLAQAHQAKSTYQGRFFSTVNELLDYEAKELLGEEAAIKALGKAPPRSWFVKCADAIAETCEQIGQALGL